ncbi:hypothetical protein C1646_687269 [Rhizophagus diaphanus]|nr:hypothetical protein C1646_687269 [Rhizophagus diaphanus] [Rhizophagus sp. MUCL 43196]
MAKFPEKIFKSLDFDSLSEKSLISLVKRDDLQMREIEIWECILKWGLKKNTTLFSDPTAWSDDDFKMMKNTLRGILPFIRFYSLSSEDFFQKVRPYKKLLNHQHQLYEKLLESYLNPNNSEPTDDILLPRSLYIDGIIDSKIVNVNIVSLISRWIDKIDIKSKYAHLRELYFPYKFNLLLRGKRDGFTPKKFHELCDNKFCTVTFIKVKGTEEIIGGYNPLEWKSGGEHAITKDSFIFSFKSKNNFKDYVLSNVIDVNNAIYYGEHVGPAFSRDIDIYVKWDARSKDYNYCQCEQKSYERGIRAKGGFFLIEDYEVFQIKRRDE